MRMRLAERRWWPWSCWTLCLLLVLLLALGLRLYRIEGQSLWNDEGTSVALAARSLEAITASAANDIHPPLYYYLLHLWIALFGNSELAARSLSALFGTLLVLLTFALGRLCIELPGSEQANNPVGLLAALFAAISPFQIHYSQEARMYALSAFMGALSMYAFVRLLGNWQAEAVGGNPPQTQRAVFRHFTAPVWGSNGHRYGMMLAYVAIACLLLYTHYFAASLIVAQNIAFLGWWLLLYRQQALQPIVHRVPILGAQRRYSGHSTPLPRGWSTVLRWAALQALVGLAYLPWLWRVSGQLRVWPAISEPVQLSAFLQDLLRVFSVGLSVQPGSVAMLAAFALLLLIGVVSSAAAAIGDVLDRGRGAGRGESSAKYTGGLAVLSYLLVPIGLMYILSLRRPMYDPKFLLLCTPPFHLLLAQGTSFLAGRASTGPEGEEWIRGYPGQGWKSSGLLLLLVAVVAVPVLSSLRAYYFDPQYARDDYRGIAQYINAVERDNDAVLINAPSQIETFDYYYAGQLPVYPLPLQRPLDETETEADLQQMIQGRGRIFAVLWATDESDPQRFVEGWLDQHAYKAMDSWYGRVRLVVYAVPAQTGSEEMDYPMQVNLGYQVRLLGYSLASAEIMPGDILQLTLFWQALVPMDERYKVFTHVLDDHGHLVGQRDAEPGGGVKITTIWEAGERIVDKYGLPVLPGTPPGDYTVEIGMYALSNGQRLPVMEGDQAVGDHIVLQKVRVLSAAAPPPISVLGMKRQLDVASQGLMLLGYDLAKLGFEHQPDAAIHPGDILHLTLFWQAQVQAEGDVTLLLQLRDDKGGVVLERKAEPTEGQHPLRLWRPGEIIRDQHNWPLPAELAPGRYHIYLSVHMLPGGEAVAPGYSTPPLRGWIRLADLMLS
jgi:mannosyltransferase